MKGIPLLLICLAVMIMCSVPVLGQNFSNIMLTLKDSCSNENIGDQLASVNLVNAETGEGKKFTSSLSEGIFSYPMLSGDWFVEFTVLDGETRKIKYYAQHSFSVHDNASEILYVEPVGSIIGIVKDNLDNVVPNADLKFECMNKMDETFKEMLPLTADGFGAFHVDMIPVGECRVYASYMNSVGFAEIVVSQGQVSNVEIKLDKNIAGEEKNYNFQFWLLLIVVVVALLVYFFIFFGKRKPVKEKAEKKDEIENRLDTIFPTLDNKEKEIVNFLLSNKNKSTQANIRHNTGIPRTSLSRCLKSLEQKNIIKVKALGKQREVCLTSWFLGKE